MTDQTKLNEVRQIVSVFAKQSQSALGVPGVFLFGSLVYRDGIRFNEEYSDVDLAVMMPASASTPVARTAFVDALRPLKVELELKLAAALSRSTAVSVCSMMVVTPREIGADIHKDGAEQFFVSNEFIEVVAGTTCRAFPRAGETPVTDRLMRQCYRFAQKKRHAYLNVAANNKGSLAPISGDAPLPKDLLRHAAMAASLGKVVPPGAEYDTQEGLSLILNFLTTKANTQAEYEELRVWILDQISTRRRTLDPKQQMLLAEIVWDVAEAERGVQERKRKHSANVSSVVFFSDRVTDAFPGKRGIYWVTDPDEIEMRLTRLFAGEITVNDSALIWRFRGWSTFGVREFRSLGHGVYLFDRDEVQVSRLALCESPGYAYHLIYVEGAPLEPIGLYEHSAEAARNAIAMGDVYHEEYGLADGLLITRAELDDGAAERNGRIISTLGRSELRCRYLTPINFVLCGKMSPLNNKKFDRRAKELLRRMLQGEDLLPTFVKEVNELPRREDD